MAASDSQIDKPQRGCHKRAELPDVNIIRGAQSINTERASLISLSKWREIPRRRGSGNFHVQVSLKVIITTKNSSAIDMDQSKT